MVRDVTAEASNLLGILYFGTLYGLTGHLQVTATGTSIPACSWSIHPSVCLSVVCGSSVHRPVCLPCRSIRRFARSFCLVDIASGSRYRPSRESLVFVFWILLLLLLLLLLWLLLLLLHLKLLRLFVSTLSGPVAFAYALFAPDVLPLLCFAVACALDVQAIPEIFEWKRHLERERAAGMYSTTVYWLVRT